MSNFTSRVIFAAVLICCACFVQSQVTVVPIPLPRFQAIDGSGRPLAFGCAFTYSSGTTTPVDSYTDSSGTTKNQNPVILSANGSANIWLLAGQNYTIKVKSSGGTQCASGSTIYTVNGIGGGASVLTTVVPFSSSPTFTDISQNQLFEMTLTGNAAALPLLVVGVTPPGLITFQITQDASGGHTFSWPANVIGGAPIGLNANQVTTQEFIWNGTTATAIGPAVTGTGPALSTGSLTASGTVLGANQGTYFPVANFSPGGTTINSLVKLTGSTPSALNALTTDTSGIVGICVANCGTTGSAIIQQAGLAMCAFDGTVVAQDFVGISSSVAGDCTDTGTAKPAQQVIGTVFASHTGAGIYPVLLTGVGSPNQSLTICADPTTTVVSANTTSNQPLKSCSIAAGALNKVGKAFRLTASVTIQPASTTASNLFWSAGASSSITNTSQAANQGSSSSTWSFQGQLTCVTSVAGASGTILCTPISNVAGAGTPTIPAVVSGWSSIDLTVPFFVGLSCAFTSGSAINACTQNIEIVELLN